MQLAGTKAITTNFLGKNAISKCFKTTGRSLSEKQKELSEVASDENYDYHQKLEKCITSYQYIVEIRSCTHNNKITFFRSIDFFAIINDFIERKNNIEQVDVKTQIPTLLNSFEERVNQTQQLFGDYLNSMTLLKDALCKVLDAAKEPGKADETGFSTVVTELKKIDNLCDSTNMKTGGTS